MKMIVFITSFNRHEDNAPLLSQVIMEPMLGLQSYFEIQVLYKSFVIQQSYLWLRFIICNSGVVCVIQFFVQFRFSMWLRFYICDWAFIVMIKVLFSDSGWFEACQALATMGFLGTLMGTVLLICWSCTYRLSSVLKITIILTQLISCKYLYVWRCKYPL